MIGIAASRPVATVASPEFGPTQWSTIIAAALAALVVVSGYALTQMQARRERRAKEFADALAAVEEYLESPYRIRRRQPSPEAREALTSALSDLQARIAFHLAWLQVEVPAVGRAYELLIAAARSEAGDQMRQAWKTAPPNDDTTMNLKTEYEHPSADSERAKVIRSMRNHLMLFPIPNKLRRK